MKDQLLAEMKDLTALRRTLDELRRKEVQGNVAPDECARLAQSYRVRLDESQDRLRRMRSKVRKRARKRDNELYTCRLRLIALREKYEAGRLTPEDYQDICSKTEHEQSLLERKVKALNDVIAADTYERLCEVLKIKPSKKPRQVSAQRSAKEPALHTEPEEPLALGEPVEVEQRIAPAEPAKVPGVFEKLDVQRDAEPVAAQPDSLPLADLLVPASADDKEPEPPRDEQSENLVAAVASQPELPPEQLTPEPASVEFDQSSAEVLRGEAVAMSEPDHAYVQRDIEQGAEAVEEAGIDEVEIIASEAPLAVEIDRTPSGFNLPVIVSKLFALTAAVLVLCAALIPWTGYSSAEGPSGVEASDYLAQLSGQDADLLASLTTTGAGRPHILYALAALGLVLVACFVHHRRVSGAILLLTGVATLALMAVVLTRDMSGLRYFEPLQRFVELKSGPFIMGLAGFVIVASGVETLVAGQAPVPEASHSK